MNTIYAFIDKQILMNRGKNLFFNKPGNILELANSSYSLFKQLKELTNECIPALIDYTVNQVVIELCRMNQYYNFGSEDKLELRNIYSDFITTLKVNKKITAEMIDDHERVFKSWLYNTNPFSRSIYNNKDLFIEPVICSEYSVEIQLSIFRIQIDQLKNPILDIGCGKNAQLVEYLKMKGFECYGLDRFSNSRSYISNTNWLEYDYGNEKWGTIISNLGFSNHFTHHHLRENGNYMDYAKTYMKILKSLKPGGSFYYAPDLTFIEHLLNKEEYMISNYRVNNCGYMATKIKKGRNE